MNKLRMESLDFTSENIEKIGALFSCTATLRVVFRDSCFDNSPEKISVRVL